MAQIILDPSVKAQPHIDEWLVRYNAKNETNLTIEQLVMETVNEAILNDQMGRLRVQIGKQAQEDIDTQVGVLKQDLG